MKFNIKITYDSDEKEYRVFVSGIKNIEGYGVTEADAVEDFKVNFKKLMET